MTNDDRFDEIIRDAASGYNRASAVPRDEMWKAIQAARVEAATGPRLHVAAGGAAHEARLEGYTVSRRFTPRYAWIGMAAAAVLLVATGVGIGRWTSDRSPVSRQPARQVVEASSDAMPLITGDGVTAPEPRAAGPAQVGRISGGTKAQRVQPQAAPARNGASIRRDPVILSLRSPTRLASANTQDETSLVQSQTASYRVATEQHLENAEALLTSFTLESRDERMNTQFAGWAKGLLSNTRLLLDSPAGDDPRRAKLLQDLELVLAQIVQLSPNALAEERELIQGSIQNGQVMTRLRTAIPAGQPRAITER